MKRIRADRAMDELDSENGHKDEVDGVPRRKGVSKVNQYIRVLHE